ncbi:MAG: Fic family protein [Myxococcota bacterium]
MSPRRVGSVPVPSVPAKPAQEPLPVTLGALLTKNGKTIETLQKDSWLLQSFARDLLKAKGIDSPTSSQLDETAFQLNAAIQANKWQEFSAPFDAEVLKLEDGVNERLGNIFSEKRIFRPDELTLERLKLGPLEAARLEGDYESGRAGMVLAASFVNTGRRSEGDFSRAYGDDAWRGFVRAHTYLREIPKGKFLEKLDLGVLTEVNRLIHALDQGIKARLLRVAAMVGRGGRWDRGGEIRNGRQFARPDDYSARELENLKESGVKVSQLTHTADGGGRALIEYPPPEEVKPRLECLLTELKADLAPPNADPIAAAAKFQRRFVALHPFGDSNGRTSRIVMNRILAEYDLPPAIFENQNRDISMSPEEWRTEVAKGVARSKAFLSSSRLESKDGYLARVDIKAIDKSPDKPITLDGNPFDLGSDGMLYDPTGRPWIAVGNEVVPLAQLEHYVLSRRILQLGKESGTEVLKKITESTRALYDKVVADPSAGKNVVVRDEQSARKADAAYRIAPEPEVAKLLTELADVSKLDPVAIFQISGAKGTAVSSAISKHSQMDLELWYLEKGLREGGYSELANQVVAQRAKLFELGRGLIEKLKDPSRVSPDNPQGFRYRYEKMMFETSPLRFSSFEEAVRKEGDRKLTVWRGDYSFSRLIGMAPNNDVRQPDAKAIAKERSKKGQLTNLFDDLVKLEGSATGKQYICTTSDLALLTYNFANSQKSQTVNLEGLPEVLKEQLFAWIDPDKGSAPMTGEQQAQARKQAEERGASVLPGANGGKELKDALGIPGTIVTVRILDKERGKIEVTAARKAFQLVLDKDALLPGVYALGGPSFVGEQEIHGLERVYPWSIKGAYTAESLREELPVTSPPQPEKDERPPA